MMRGLGWFVLVAGMTAALIPFPHVFPLWCAVILIVFFCTLPERSEPRTRAVKRTRERGD